MYLTEERLGEFLSEIFPQHQFIHDKTVPNSNLRSRPDYRNDDLKLIVEFDGYQHYTISSYVLTDAKKDVAYSKMGYKVVRIPYFVQLSTLTLKLLFDLDIEYGQIYPHGFIDPKATLPADFCELGVARFKRELITFKDIKEDIIKSLNAHLTSKDIEIVYPLSMI